MTRTSAINAINNGSLKAETKPSAKAPAKKTAKADTAKVKADLAALIKGDSESVKAAVAKHAAEKAKTEASKPSKAPKAEKAPRAEGVVVPSAKEAGMSKAELMEKKVKVLVDENPKRGESAKRFDLYKNGMTGAEAVEKGVRLADLRWDVAHGFIKMT